MLCRERGDITWRQGVWEGKSGLAASPSSEHPSPCAGSPTTAKAERRFTLGVRGCCGCQLPHCLSLAGKLWSNWNSDSLGTCEGSITPGQGLNPLQRSTWGKALGAMHVDADALKPFPVEIFHKASREKGWAQTHPRNCSGTNGLPSKPGHPGHQPGAGRRKKASSPQPAAPLRPEVAETLPLTVLLGPVRPSCCSTGRLSNLRWFFQPFQFQP